MVTPSRLTVVGNDHDQTGAGICPGARAWGAQLCSPNFARAVTAPLGGGARTGTAHQGWTQAFFSAKHGPQVIDDGEGRVDNCANALKSEKPTRPAEQPAAQDQATREARGGAAARDRG